MSTPNPNPESLPWWNRPIGRSGGRRAATNSFADYDFSVEENEEEVPEESTPAPAPAWDTVAAGDSPILEAVPASTTNIAAVPSFTPPAGKRLAPASDVPAEKVLSEAKELTDKLLDALPANSKGGDLSELLVTATSHLETYEAHAGTRTLALACTAAESELARRTAEELAKEARALATARAAADSALDSALEEAGLGRLGAVKVDQLLDYEAADTLMVQLVQYTLTHKIGDPMTEADRAVFLDAFSTIVGIQQGTEDWEKHLPVLLEVHGDSPTGLEDWWDTCARDDDGEPALSPEEVAQFSYEPLEALTRWWGKHPEGSSVPAPLHRVRDVFGIHRLTPSALAATQELAATGFTTDAPRESEEFYHVAVAATNATVLAYQMRSSGRRTAAASDLTSKLPDPHRDLLERLLALQD